MQNMKQRKKEIKKEKIKLKRKILKKTYLANIQKRSAIKR